MDAALTVACRLLFQMGLRAQEGQHTGVRRGMPRVEAKVGDGGRRANRRGGGGGGRRGGGFGGKGGEVDRPGRVSGSP